MTAVVHLLPRDLARGAQRHARLLSDGLEAIAPQYVVALYGPDRGVARPDVLLAPEVLERPTLQDRLRAIRRLRRLLRELDPTVVVAHGSEPLWHAAPIVARSRLVYHRIGISHLNPAGPSGKLRIRAHRILLRRPLTVVAVSSDVARELTAVFKVPEERIRVIPNGRNAELFHPRSSASDARPVIGFVGHLTESKRPDLFLRVLEHVAETVPCRGVVIGDGPMAGAVAAMADHLPVDLLGPRADVPELLREMDVFVLTSQPEGEGMPGVLIEAALTGLAIVTTDVPGARDVVLQGVTGMIVPADDETALTDSVLGLLGDEERRNELGAAGRERAVRHLSIGSCVDAWGSLLAGMGAGGGR